MIRVDGISWAPGGHAAAAVLDSVSFEVPAGGYAVLMGRTGAGKTSLLEILCGLRPPSAGRIFIGGRDVTDAAPRDRGIGYVPQDGALFPTLTVRQQIGFGLRMRHAPPARIEAAVLEAAANAGVSHLLERLPPGLSGGECRRVALARALAVRPAVLLLDEPLASVDEETQGGLIELLRQTWREHRVTVLHVTHSRREAESLGDLRLRLEQGRILPERTVP
jgi:ABC-type sugar transport system ATPase subunit